MLYVHGCLAHACLANACHTPDPLLSSRIDVRVLVIGHMYLVPDCVYICQCQ